MSLRVTTATDPTSVEENNRILENSSNQSTLEELGEDPKVVGVGPAHSIAHPGPFFALRLPGNEAHVDRRPSRPLSQEVPTINRKTAHHHGCCRLTRQNLSTVVSSTLNRALSLFTTLRSVFVDPVFGCLIAPPPFKVRTQSP
jgi:hypothetical protein